MHLVSFAEFECMKLEQITKVTENVTLNKFCNFLFYKSIVNIITNREIKDVRNRENVSQSMQKGMYLSWQTELI